MVVMMKMMMMMVVRAKNIAVQMFRLYLSTILPTPWYCQYLTHTHSDTVILTGQWQL